MSLNDTQLYSFIRPEIIAFLISLTSCIRPIERPPLKLYIHNHFILHFLQSKLLSLLSWIIAIDFQLTYLLVPLPSTVYFQNNGQDYHIKRYLCPATPLLRTLWSSPHTQKNKSQSPYNSLWDPIKPNSLFSLWPHLLLFSPHSIQTPWPPHCLSICQTCYCFRILYSHFFLPVILPRELHVSLLHLFKTVIMLIFQWSHPDHSYLKLYTQQPALLNPKPLYKSTIKKKITLDL